MLGLFVHNSVWQVLSICSMTPLGSRGRNAFGRLSEAALQAVSCFLTAHADCLLCLGITSHYRMLHTHTQPSAEVMSTLVRSSDWKQAYVSNTHARGIPPGHGSLVLLKEQSLKLASRSTT